MTAAEKIFRWLEEQGMTARSFHQLSGIPETVLSNVKKGEYRVSVMQARRASAVMGVPLDWLLDDKARWPPPKLGAMSRELTEAEQKLLDLAHDISEGDPSLKRVFRRLLFTESAPLADQARNILPETGNVPADDPAPTPTPNRRRKKGHSA